MYKYLEEVDIEAYKIDDNDTSSLPYMIAYWTARILLMTDTLVEQRKNHNVKRYLQLALQKRWRLLRALYRKDNEVYRKVVNKLGITKAVDPVQIMKTRAAVFDTQGAEGRYKSMKRHGFRGPRITYKARHLVLERPKGTPQGPVPVLDLDWSSKEPRKVSWMAETGKQYQPARFIR